ncbi:MAG: type I glyceraldehyde-3-phosphate dehydrogenase [Crocinitomicaceae bacterium]|nr:type I glyceraldehyde-3-phosphate dehydrogenase [Crocinitomicaceae bacterium]
MSVKNKIGVNGFGRIGRYLTRMAVLDPDVEIGLVNDLADIEALMHLFKYDSVHGKFELDFEISGNTVVFTNGKQLTFSQEKNPELISWSAFDVQTVVECTGSFLTTESASKHLKGGAKKVVLSAPAKEQGIRTVVLGVNDHLLEDTDVIVSNASCTTNNVAPIVKVIKTLAEIELCYISTIHSYTSDQRLHDAPHKDPRRARAAANSIIPTSTGAANAIVKIFPELSGKIDGGAIRVPVLNGSMTEITFNLSSELSIEKVHEAMQTESVNAMKGVLGVIDEPIVSVDIIGSPLSSGYDKLLSKSFGKMIKVIAWYDNEAGYSNRLLELSKRVNK